MIFLGRYDRGSEVVLGISCENASGVVTSPDEAPTVEVENESGKVLVEGKIPASDSQLTPGLFRLPLFLGAPFVAGNYLATVRFLLSGVSYARMLSFEVTPGGDPSGAVIAMHQYEKPDARYLVHSTDSGSIFKGKNPRVPA